MAYTFAPGSTSQSIQFFLRDSTNGLAKTGLTATSPGALCGYTRQNGSAAPVALSALSGPTAAWSSGGFVEVDPVNAPGIYRLDVPNAALAAGVPFVSFVLAFTGSLGDSALVLLQQQLTNVGPGAVPLNVTVQNSSTLSPLSGAAVWVTTDSAGSNVVAGTLTTNALGQVQFLLSPGTYYVWINDPGWTGTNPTTVTVS